MTNAELRVRKILQVIRIAVNYNPRWAAASPTNATDIPDERVGGGVMANNGNRKWAGARVKAVRKSNSKGF